MWEQLTHEQTAPDRIRERPAYLALVPGYVGAGALAARAWTVIGDLALLGVAAAVTALATRRLTEDA